MKNPFARVWAFIFYRCYVCDRQIGKEEEYCSSECAKKAGEHQAYNAIP